MDLVVERDDRRVVAVEVKLSAAVDDRDVRHLLWLRERVGEDLLDAVVVTTGPQAYRESIKDRGARRFVEAHFSSGGA